MTIGMFLKKCRRDKRLTLKDVRGGTSISISFISDIERDTARPSIKTFDKLLRFYGKTYTLGNAQNWLLAEMEDSIKRTREIFGMPDTKGAVCTCGKEMKEVAHARWHCICGEEYIGFT